MSCQAMLKSDCIWMHFNIWFSTVEMNWLFSHCPCSVLLLAANGHAQSPSQMLLYSSQNAVYRSTCSVLVWSPLPTTVGFDTRIPFHLEGLLLRAVLLQWALCKLEVLLGACPWVGGFSVGEKKKWKYFCESKALLFMWKSRDFPLSLARVLG